MKKTMITGIALVLVLSGCSLGNLKKAEQVNLSAEDAKTKVTSFINDTLVQPGSEVTVEAPVIENGLYKFKVTLQDGKTVDAYMTRDGKKFFPQALDIEETLKQAGDQAAGATDEAAQAPEQKDIPKTDKPKVEAFVMSYCPYGTQIEKGLIPTIKALGDKVDFKLRFVSYAMHEKQEIDENLLQYCIQKEESAKLLPYLDCFLKDGKSADCQKAAGLNAGKIEACSKSADKEFKITENYNDKKTWQGQFPPFNTDKALNDKYSVQGSPTLVINGVQAEAGRDAASLLTAICNAMNKPGKECEAKLSSAAPAPGFGDGSATGGAASNAGCGQ